MQHEGLDWPERIKIMQRNWVGRSEGTEISFALDYPGVEEKEIRVFTTRPDTVFGVPSWCWPRSTRWWPS